MSLNLLSILVALFFTWHSLDYGDEWPDWRGPGRDGKWQEKGILKKFDSDQIDIKWSIPVSAGYSGPSVSDNRVYITDRINRPEEIERVLCVDAGTGNTIWSFSYDCEYIGVGYPAGPRASVIIDEKRAYSLGTMGHLFCFQKETGKVLWQKDLNKEYEIRMPTWGISAAPLVVEDKIILNIGGSNNACVIALDKLTGEELWRNLEDDTSYAAPILIKQANKPVVVVWTGQRVLGLNPETGSVYWHQEFLQKRMIMNIATPVLYNNYLFVSNFFDGSMLLELGEKELSASKVWQRGGKNERNTDALHCCISTPLIIGNFIYGVDSYGELRCLDLKTGNRIWEDQSAVKRARWANIHFVKNGDLIYMFNENGELLIANLSEKGYHEISRAKLIEPTNEQLNRSGIGVTWAHPAFAYKHIFVRSDTELVCADLSEK
ncbi:MAG: PQQ-binding-like beta-propeller repeat protein [Cyclobacteriaceae bacterium]|nr:PQQ-binding-like beta-propeller repeat protein [Cyclobacteriaceae bacterium]